jgi:hypothetical protein
MEVINRPYNSQQLWRFPAEILEIISNNSGYRVKLTYVDIFFWDGACFSVFSNIARWSFPAAFETHGHIARIMNLGGDEMKQAKAKLEELGSPWGRHGHHLGVCKDLIWLVSNIWIMFHFIMGCHPSHSRTPSFFKMVETTNQ